jgi:polygalacturonase
MCRRRWREGVRSTRKVSNRPIFLKSNLEFEVLAGATLMGSTNFADYPTIPGWWEGLERTIYASMIIGIDLENVAITGQGMLDGQGAVWLEAWGRTQELRKKFGLAGREPENPPGSPLPWPRPRMINLYRSRKVLIRGLTIHNSPSWTVHPVLCEDVYIEGLRLSTQHTRGIQMVLTPSTAMCASLAATSAQGMTALCSSPATSRFPESPFRPRRTLP